MDNNTWDSRLQDAYRTLQQISTQVDQRIAGIRGGQDRSVFVQLHSRNQQQLRALSREIDNLDQSLQTDLQESLASKEYQLYASRLDKLRQQFESVDKRARMTDSEILGEARFHHFFSFTSFVFIYSLFFFLFFLLLGMACLLVQIHK